MAETRRQSFSYTMTCVVMETGLRFYLSFSFSVQKANNIQISCPPHQRNALVLLIHNLYVNS